MADLTSSSGNFRVPTKKTHVELIRLSDIDLDRPLYRIYSVWHFESALRTNGGNLALVLPSAWADPHEDPCASLQMAAPDHTQKSLIDYLCPAYAQCWSFEGDSDVLLRAYSRVTRDTDSGRNVEPKLEGVRVRTTPRRIVESVENFCKSHSNNPFLFYLAAIEYVDDAPQSIINQLNQIGPTAIGQGRDRARSLTFKRKAFQHEQEVRLIALTQKQTQIREKYITVNVKPNDIFKEIQFDPRLLEFERREREAKVRSLGYSEAIATDTLYQKTLLLAQLTASWDELDAQFGSQEADYTLR